MIPLNPQQQAAARHHDGPAIVLAVAGAGKTTVMCSRIAHLMTVHQVNPAAICNLTFSRASARDMAARFQQLFGHLSGSNQVQFSTIHSLAYQVVSRAYRFEHRHIHLIEDRRQQLYKPRILRAIYRQINQTFPGEDEMEELLQQISLVKNKMIPEDEMESLCGAVKRFRDIYLRYESYKKANHWLDYDDLLVVTWEIFSRNTTFLKQYQNRYLYWQVDEFQDTSPIQWEIIRLLTAPENQLFCVGDDDQMIYSFRGSSPRLLLDFPTLYPEAAVYVMDQNYRCPQELVTASNGVIRLNQQRYAKEAVSQAGSGGRLEIRSFSDGRQQLEGIISKVTQWLQQETVSVGLLYRNNLSAVVLADALHEAGISFRSRDLKMTFYSHWLTQDLLHIIDFAYAPHDLELFEKIYYKLNGYVSKQMIAWLKQHAPANEGPLLSHLCQSPLLSEHYRQKSVKELARNLQSLTRQSSDGIIPFLVDQLGYGQYLERKKQVSRETAFQLLEMIHWLSRSIHQPLQLRQQLLDTGRRGSDPVQISDNQTTPRVTLSTVHGAKGLEYDFVAVLDVAAHTFPAPGSVKTALEKGDQSQLEEERRLMYVAMTRARKELWLCCPQSCFRESLQESLFVSEVRHALPEAFSQKSFPVTTGEAVVHSTFGPGEVMSVSETSVAIRFRDEVRHIARDFLRRVLVGKASS
ncbi:ATP-dependent helicase [Anoxynatronum sibiricum]|uniref:DNA 3'-5' helicase n=1 Tax=Anoxynatronum sibiricum TaxID=210623 RepID=A0ABU9VTF6_9CLOT